MTRNGYAWLLGQRGDLKAAFALLPEHPCSEEDWIALLLRGLIGLEASRFAEARSSFAKAETSPFLGVARRARALRSLAQLCEPQNEPAKVALPDIAESGDIGRVVYMYRDLLSQDKPAAERRLVGAIAREEMRAVFEGLSLLTAVALRESKARVRVTSLIGGLVMGAGPKSSYAASS